MKGFLHIVEILIVSMLVFLVIIQLSAVPKQNIDWGSMQLSMQANDLLFSLDKKGIDWFNYSELNASLHPVLHSNTIYILKIRNSMKPEIKVGCVCTPLEEQAVRNSLGYFDVNGHGVRFSVTPITTIAFSHEYDVIVINDTNLDAYRSQIEQFLKADKGIVEFRLLQQPEIDSVQMDFFGILWNSTDPLKTPDSSSIEFQSNESIGPYYSIYKYFHSIPIYQENFSNGASGWTPLEAGGDDWSVSGGNYIGANDTADGVYSITTYPTSFDGPYTLKANFRIDDSPPLYHKAQLILYWQDPSNYVMVDFNADADRVTVYENISGILTTNDFADSVTLNPNQWYEAKIVTLKNKRVMVYINKSLVLATTSPITNPLNGKAGLGVAYGQARFDDLRVVFSEKHVFADSLLFAGENFWPKSNSLQKSVLLQKNTMLPACIVNSNIVANNGRAAWLAYSDPAASQDVSNMLRTLVVWAAGDENDVAKNDIKNIPVITRLYKTYDRDMYEPVEIELTMGNLYG